MGKKRREAVRVPVPDVLWRVFGKRARALSDFITSPSLLRRGDPWAYRNLFTRCFLVVSGDSPTAIPRPSPHSHWPQREIVARTIEMMISDQSLSSNVLCSGYDKYSQSSPLMEILTGPEWCLLLERVGEQVMTFLLKHTSIFLPLTRKKYHQVAGPPSSDLCFKKTGDTFKTRVSSSQSTETGKKRERENDVFQQSRRQQRTSPSEIDGTLSTVTCIRDCEVGDSLGPLVCDQDSEKHSQSLDLEIASEMTKNMMLNSENDATQESQKNPDEGAKKVRKRQRPCRSQRRRIRKQLDLQEMAGEASSQTKREVTRHVAKEAEVNRKILFYNLEVFSSALPREHILNSLRPDTAGAMFLLKSIFGISEEMASPDTVPCSQHARSLSDFDSDSVCMYHSLIVWLKNLIRRARRCQHLRLLNKHCVVQTRDQIAVSELENQEENSESQHGMNLRGSDCEDIKSYSQKSQVVSFVWAACRSIIPSPLLGSKKNWRILTRNISKFVQLRRFEKFSLKQCMHRLKTSEFPLFANKRSLCCLSNQGKTSAGLNEASPEMKQRIVESWVYWVFSYIVVPLLQANFYVTDSERGRQEIFYYRKSVWEKVKKRAISALKDKSYVQLDDATARDTVKRRRFGFSKLRLLPKENGLRLLANLKAPSRMPKVDSYQQRELVGAHGRRKKLKRKCDSYYFKPVNYVLREAHAILKGTQLKRPEKLGSSVFDYNDVYRKLRPFLIGLKRSFSEMPAVFLIASDVSKAFDSVCQNKLLSVLNDVLRHDKYTLKQFSEVCCSNRFVWVRENLALLDENTNSRFISAISCRSTDSILVDKECRKVVKREELLFNLYEHIKSNVLQLNKKFYLQRVGICQGSVLSSLLCALYYGDMDNKVIFPFLERVSQPGSRSCTSNGACQIASGSQITEDYLLLRFTDDFLFISTSRKQAESFFSRLSRGFRDYNCYMNKDKYTVSFDVSHVSEAPSNRLCVGKDDVSHLRWSGLLINCTTLEVQADYTKYYNNHLSSTLTVSWQDKPGRRLEQKLCRFMRPKCHPLFYDPNINSPGVVRLNIFQSFLLSAMKFHCYLRDLSYICKFPARSYLRTIENSFRYMHILIKRRMRSPSLGLDTNPIQHLGAEEVEWLGLNAYIQVLTRKQSRHKRLVSLLKYKLSIHDLSWKRSSELDYAVDVSNSALVWKIKY